MTITTTATEVLDPDKAHAKEVELHQRAAVDSVVAGALMPGMPGVDEFQSLCLQAKLLSMSGAAPKLIKGNPHIALHVVMIGRDLGISPSAAVELIDVIDTQQGPRPSLSPQLLNGQIRRMGLGSIVKAHDDDVGCTALAMGPGGRLDMRCQRSFPFHWYDDDKYADLAEHRQTCTCTPELWIGTTSFTWEDAKVAGLVAKNCEPGDHKTGSDGKCGCNFGYKNYWPRMRWWRASGFCADDFFPEAGLGLYTAEELGALVDADGRAIDVASVEVPPGYEPQKGQPGYVPPPREITDEEYMQLLELQERVMVLPADAQATVKERWRQMPKLKGQTLSTLDPALIGLVSSVLRGIEQGVKSESKGAWDPEVERAKLHKQIGGAVANLLCPFAAPQETPAQEPQEPSPSPDPTMGPPEDSGPQERPQAPNPGDSGPPAEDDGSSLLREADPEALSRAVKEVRALGAKELDAQLRAQTPSLSTEGPIEERRKRLVIAMLRTAVAPS